MPERKAALPPRQTSGTNKPAGPQNMLMIEIRMFMLISDSPAKTDIFAKPRQPCKTNGTTWGGRKKKIPGWKATRGGRKATGGRREAMGGGRKATLLEWKETGASGKQLESNIQLHSACVCLLKCCYPVAFCRLSGPEKLLSARGGRKAAGGRQKSCKKLPMGGAPWRCG